MLESGREESMQSVLEVVILRGGGFEILTSTSMHIVRLRVLCI